MAVIIKEIPYSERSLDVLKRVQKIKCNNLSGLLGLCLYRAEIGWAESQRLKVEDVREKEERKETKSILLFMQKYEMNLLEYVSLRRRNIQMFTVQEIRTFVNQMLSVLERLQKEGIAHRDVKPENILVHHDTYLLCDFEDAIEVRPNERPSVDLTTVEYSSPEFLRFIRHPKDKLFDPFKLDVYSFGLTLLFLCSMGKFSLEERTNFIYESS
jgi:serine/threonine protein kinase